MIDKLHNSESTLYLSDCNSYEGFKSIELFYPSPEICQDLNKKIFESIFIKESNTNSFEDLFDTVINRFFVTDIKLLEHPLILQNILSHCKENLIFKIVLAINPANKNLANYYSEQFVSHGLLVETRYHNLNYWWKNSLSKSKGSIKYFVKMNLAPFFQLFFLLLNSVKPNSKFKSNKFIFWLSFANNREKVDYRLLDELSDNGLLNVIHPNPFLFSSKQTWNKSIYFLGKYSCSPFDFFRIYFSLFFFKSKLNSYLKDFENFSGPYPVAWNREVLLKTKLFMIYNFLVNKLVEKTSKDKTIKVLNVFRGGSAAGLIYSGITKRKYLANHVTNILVPHGTEINPIDHYSYFYMDYNILPTQKIVDNWDAQLTCNSQHILQFSTCKNVAGGRIDYDYLLDNVKLRVLDIVFTKKVLTVGIILTYNSDAYQELFINQVAKLFSKCFSIECSFLIKPRPNLKFEEDNFTGVVGKISVFKGDMFQFLNSVDIVIGTVSVYGVLTMAVTDSILCNIPALYFLPEKNITSKDLGYSYHDSMSNFTYYTETKMYDYLISFNNDIGRMLLDLNSLNSVTREMISYPESGNEFIKSLINSIFHK
jgi:hypothetical protein